MSKKVQCPDCGRHFSEHLVKFPMFFDDKDETIVYYKCPLCAYEEINKSQGTKLVNPFRTEHAYNLFKEALREIEKSAEKKKPAAKKAIKWEKLVRLTLQEYEAVIKKHPELLKK